MVLIVNDYAFVNGGASQTAILSALQLAKRGQEVHFFAGVGPCDPRLESSGVRVWCLQQEDLLSEDNRLVAGLRGLWNLSAAKAIDSLCGMLQRGKGVAHVHMWYKSLSASVVDRLLRRGVPVVATLHDYTAVCPNGSFYNYREERVCSLRPLSLACICTNCDQRSYPQKLWRVARNSIQDKLGRMPKGLKCIIAVSEFSRQVMAAYLPSKVEVCVIGNPVDAPRRERVDVRRNSDFVFLGRLVPQKGPDICAFAGAKVGAKMVFVGDGEMLDGLRRQVPEARFLGWVEKDQVAETLAQARVLVFSSRCYETQGIAVAEAAALGVPAIVPRESAASDMVVHGESGLHFRMGSGDDLARMMALVMEDSYVDQLGKTAYERFWGNPPGLDAHAALLERVYERVRQTA